MYECPKAVPEDPQYEENLPRLLLYAGGLARTEALAALCAPLRQEPERSTTMPSLSEIAGDERTARMVLSMLVESEDAVTGRLLATVGAVETLRLGESDGGPRTCLPYVRSQVRMAKNVTAAR